MPENKYQEALNYLASLWEIEGDITVTSDPFDRFNRVETLVEDRVCRADRGNVKLLQELVDMETETDVVHEIDDDGWHRYKCPECGDEVAGHWDYCPFCGKHLRWNWEAYTNA